MYHQYREGWLEVICGCMFSGKTEELIRRINVLSYAKKNIVVFKPKVDNRYSDTEIVSHSGSRVPCKIVEKAQDILLYVQETIETLDRNYPFISPNNFVLGMLFPIEKQLVYSENKNYSLREDLSKEILDLRKKYKPSYFSPKGIPFFQKVKIAVGYHGLTKRICQILKYFRWIPFVRYML